MRTRHVNVMLLVTLAMLLIATVLAAGCGSTTTTAASGTSSPVTEASTSTSSSTDTTAPAAKVGLVGAGATFPAPLYLEWIGAYQEVTQNVSVNYQGVGSGGGIQQFTQLTVDFGASDAPMKDEEIAAAEAASGARVLHIPTVFGAITLAYNVPGLTELKLDADVVTEIFLGKVERWNDAGIAALNPGAELPDQPIGVVHRSDSSGTTHAFTSYLSAVSPEWKSAVGAGKEVKWPVGSGGQGNDGVAAVIQQQPYSLGYVELAYAIETKLAVASLKNQAGNFVAPSLASTTAAAAGVSFPDDLRFSVANSPAQDAYPIVTATWILAYDAMKDAGRAQALKDWLTWALTDGDDLAHDLGYATLPDNLRQAALAKVDQIN